MSGRLGRPRLGFLGLGRIGVARLGSVLDADHADVVAIADCSRRTCDDVHRLVPRATVGSRLDDLLACGVDGVVIATPSGRHAIESIQALQAGVAVFCQKPLGRSSREVAAVLDTARASNRLLGIDLSYRGTQAMTAVAAELAARAIGDVYAAELTFHNAYGPDRPWFYDLNTSGGGCLMDLGTHLIDLLLWTTGTTVRHVSSRLYTRGTRVSAPIDCTEDFASLTLDLSNGASAAVQCSWKLQAGQPAIIDCRWYGTNGGLRFANVDGSFFDFVAERLDGTRTETLVAPPDAWGGRMVNVWIDRLRADATFDPSIADARHVADVIDRAYGAHEPAAV